MTAPRRRRRKTDEDATASTPLPPAETVETAETAAPRLLARVPIRVRWRDLDAFNHVNNATFLSYLEEARLVWLSQTDGPWFSETYMPVLAATQVNYRQQIEWPGEVIVELFVQRIGNSSLTVSHRILAAHEPTTLYSDGHVVMVWIEPAHGGAIALPPIILQACQ